jgi:hypothetical protein
MGSMRSGIEEKDARMGNKTAANARSSEQLHPESQQSERQRTRRTFYMDSEVISAVDQCYKDVNHQLYPDEVNKSVFLEALIRYGLENMEEIKSILTKSTTQP